MQEIKSTKESPVEKTKNIQYIRNIIFLVIGFGIIYMVFKNQNFDDIWKVLKTANLWWIVPVFFALICGSILRTLRWQLILASLNYSSSFFNLFNSLMFGYFVNLGIPRLGEFSRCFSLKKKENIPVATAFGTVMVERMADMLFLVITVCIAFYLEYATISQFFKENIFAPLWGLVQKNILDKPIVLGLIVFGIGYLFYYLYKNTSTNESQPQTKLDNMTNEVWDGLMSFTKINNYPLFIAYSLFIWIMYGITSYFWLLAFAETKVLALGVVFVIFVVSNIGKSVPVQGGGMGAYHYLVSAALLLFGIANPVGYAYAIINHGSVTLYNIILGIYSWAALTLSKDKSEEYF